MPRIIRAKSDSVEIVAGHFGFLRLLGRELSDTCNVKAFWRVAPSVRLSARAMRDAGVFCRASDLSSRTSCAVHSRLFDFLATLHNLPNLPWRGRRRLSQTATGTCRVSQAAFATGAIFIACR